jgi:hypothetical protein
VELGDEVFIHTFYYLAMAVMGGIGSINRMIYGEDWTAVFNAEHC